MFRRYHLEVKDAKLDAPLPRIQVERDDDRCIGCGICARACIYEVHARESALVDFTRMAEPVHGKCVACHRCVNECPKDALTLRPHPDLAALGDSYFSAETIETLHYEADTGRVPVSGCGYRGPFSGPGFDRMWTDMSEIVRPTRDGIHGRETICTGVALGRKRSRWSSTRSPSRPRSRRAWAWPARRPARRRQPARSPSSMRISPTTWEAGRRRCGSRRPRRPSPRATRAWPTSSSPTGRRRWERSRP
ncbi:MAG: 4Fe-4S binding protein [Elusimicrobia bacterium]|nr:4Fe-4S binding protein [Elusimicrobiota bacterium]